ncbi:unnamed protein product, partial [Staurois parvus]
QESNSLREKVTELSQSLTDKERDSQKAKNEIKSMKEADEKIGRILKDRERELKDKERLGEVEKSELRREIAELSYALVEKEKHAQVMEQELRLRGEKIEALGQVLLDKEQEMSMKEIERLYLRRKVVELSQVRSEKERQVEVTVADMMSLKVKRGEFQQVLMDKDQEMEPKDRKEQAETAKGMQFLDGNREDLDNQQEEIKAQGMDIQYTKEDIGIYEMEEDIKALYHEREESSKREMMLRQRLEKTETALRKMEADEISRRKSSQELEAGKQKHKECDNCRHTASSK